MTGIYLITGIGLTSNSYVIGEQEATIIDSGNGTRPNTLFRQLQNTYLNINDLAQVIVTHTHFDHIGGLSSLFGHASPKVLVHETEHKLLLSMIGHKHVTTVRDGDIIDIDSTSLHVLHTPGHSPGSICLYDQTKRILYSGDTVFPNGFFGRWDLRGGNAVALVQSLDRLRTMDIDILLPGHEHPVFKNAKQHIELSYRNACAYSS